MNMISKLFAGGEGVNATTSTAKPADKPATKQAKRIYEVTNTMGLPARLVRAQNRAQAVAHVVGTSFAADVPSQDRLLELAGLQVSVEDTGE